MTLSRAAQQAWMTQWRRAAPVLEAQRRQELRELSSAEALAASDALLALAVSTSINPDRLTDSGLVRRQALFHQRRG